MKFADKLRELRETKSMTREQLAEAMGISVHTIIHWEQGNRTPSFPMVQAICKALGVRCMVFDGVEFGEAEEKPGRGRPKKKPD